jgi:hypothetical protein
LKKQIMLFAIGKGTFIKFITLASNCEGGE